MSFPVLTDSSGKINVDVDFKLGFMDEVYHSCTLTWKGEHFVIGGDRRRTQISKIVGCRLKQVGDLQFAHASVACTNVANNFIYLCFNEMFGDLKRCRKSTGPLARFTEIDLSLYPHSRTFIASSTSKLQLHYLVYTDFQKRYLLLEAIISKKNTSKKERFCQGLIHICFIERLRFSKQKKTNGSRSIPTRQSRS